jgi:hypothetical protein
LKHKDRKVAGGRRVQRPKRVCGIGRSRDSTCGDLHH